MKTFLTRTLPLILSIALGTAMSWASMYMFLFAVWMFHSAPAVRAATAVGDFLLLPGRWTFEAIGGDQTTQFYTPEAFAGTNGLLLGIIFYCIFRAILNYRTSGQAVPQENAAGQRQVAKVT